jgi:hypothetical protein
MTTFTGHYGSAVDYVTVTNQSVNIQDDDGVQVFDVVELSANTAGSITDNLPIQQSVTNFSGDAGYSGSGNDFFYHRFHITPSEFPAGNIVGEQSNTISVWNGHLTAKSISDLSESGDLSGVSLTPPSAIPFVFASLDEIDFTLDISSDGASLIDGVYTLTFSTGEELTLSVTGQRVFVWSFKPNWDKGVEERIEWATDVMTSYDGSEQRMSLRQNPRRVFSYEFMIDNNADRRKFEAILFNWGARPWMFPVWTEVNTLASTLVSGSTSFEINRKSGDWQEGGYAVLFASAFNFETVKISTISGTTINLNSPTIAEWPEGTLVYPCYTALLEDKQELTRFNGQTEFGRCTMRLVGVETVAADAPTEYRSLPVIEAIPDWSREITNDYLRKLQMVDYRTGIFAQEDQSGMPFGIHSHHWTLDGKDEIDDFRKFIYARAGKHKAVWLPTFTPDIEPAANIGASDSYIDVEHGFITQHLWGHKNRRDIMIEITGGARYYRRITNCVEISGTVERISISTPLGIDVDVDDVSRISWMSVARFDSDNLTLQWRHDDWLECSANWRTVRDDV